jgi:hypothetical protein
LVLLISEAGARKGIRQVVGTNNPQALPLVYASADETLVGEEMFAGSAYTTRLPIQVGSLLTQDLLRWVLVVSIIVVAVFKFLS